MLYDLVGGHINIFQMKSHRTYTPPIDVVKDILYDVCDVVVEPCSAYGIRYIWLWGIQQGHTHNKGYRVRAVYYKETVPLSYYPTTQHLSHICYVLLAYLLLGALSL